MLPDIKNILYCTQLGRNSAYIFRWAASLARATGAKVHVLHVLETLHPLQAALVQGYVGRYAYDCAVDKMGGEALAELKQQVRAFCQKAAGEHFDMGQIGSIHVAQGRVKKQILAHIEQTNADMIVMGAHTESALVEGILGSSTQNIIRSSRVPVMVIQVPEGKQELTGLE